MTTENLKLTVSTSTLDILRGIPSSGRIRTASIDFQNLATRDSSVFKGREDEASQIARTTLEALRQNTDIYSAYARPDILHGLAAINHPATQLVIAESVLEKEEHVTNAAISLLTKAKEIYPETIVYLLKQEGVKAKALSIIEQNKTAGIQDGKIIPEVKDVLLEMLEPDSDIKERKRAITITALLHERSSDSMLHALSAKSTSFLLERINGVVRKLSERDTFFSLVEVLVSANHNAVKSSDAKQMEIVVPQALIAETEEMVTTLSRLGQSSSENIVRYRSLIALAKRWARTGLQTRIAEEEKEEQIKLLTKQQEEALINQRKAADRQREEETRKRLKENALSEEESLATKALSLFPNLKP
jgi:hypothetical protein